MTHETGPSSAPYQEGKIFVLVHGGGHGAWAFERLTPLLVQEGHYVVARDLPGHGLRARVPRSYTTRPLHAQEFAHEPSPIAHLRLADYRDQVIATVRRLAERMPDREIVLLGHSMAGLILNEVGEAVPELIGRLVYLSAWMTGDGTAFTDYMSEPEFATGLIPSILLADPAVAGALRMDFRSNDPGYRAGVKAAFAADVEDDEWDAIANLLSPDTPAGPLAERVTVTADRWGRIPRTYICCTNDQALPLPAQHRFVKEADHHTPGNPTDVRELPTSHSPFASAPDQLAEALLQL
ncbi:alpha/beta fold hydrolase [Kribbella voronezhensis]|uniref:alpha/beta fold hydrolase n=1 Tax=Kribbella voronezhensis TaxID=2512212 RepID=UPI00192E2C68|nr:alpha/beta fold hydrolase [Kribbella voronezhensis]